MRFFSRSRWLITVPAALLLSGSFVACGKDANVHAPALLEFPHSFPEAPRQLVSQLAPAWTTGHPIVATETHLFLSDRDNEELVRLDRKTLARQKAVSLGGKPEQLVIAADGAILVTMRSTGEVLRLSQELVIEKRLQVSGSEVYGIALSLDGETAYVTLPQDNKIAAIDVGELTRLGDELDDLVVLDTPRGISMNRNDKLLVVHQFADAMLVEVDRASGALVAGFQSPLRIANPANHAQMSGRINGLRASRALAGTVNPETGAAYVAHVTAAPGTSAEFESALFNGGVTDDPGGGGGYGGSSTPGATFNIPTRPIEVTVSTVTEAGTTVAESDFPVQDITTGEPMAHLVDDPIDIAHHPDWSLLFVVGYGSDNVLVTSTAEGDTMRSTLAVIEVGHAPRGIAFSPDGKTAYVVNEHALTVSVIELAPLMSMSVRASSAPVVANPSFDGEPMGESASFMPVPGFQGDPQTPNAFKATFDESPSSPRVTPIRMKSSQSKAYGTDPMPAELRRGARTFTFARNENLSHAGQFACGTCHFEGTEDKLVWFITDGPRQTPALAGRLLGTAPFNWAGSKDGLADNMIQTVERMGGDGLTNTELKDLEQFLLYGLEAPINPNLAADNTLTAEQQRGKVLFEDKTVGCAGCHKTDENFTDGFRHDVGTANKLELTQFEFAVALDPNAAPAWKLNTPTLRGLFYTAPYLHDGSAADLTEVLNRTGDTMGKTSHLSESQKADLVAYLKAL